MIYATSGPSRVSVISFVPLPQDRLVPISCSSCPDASIKKMESRGTPNSQWTLTQMRNKPLCCELLKPGGCLLRQHNLAYIESTSYPIQQIFSHSFHNPENIPYAKTTLSIMKITKIHKVSCLSSIVLVLSSKIRHVFRLLQYNAKYHKSLWRPANKEPLGFRKGRNSITLEKPEKVA